MWFHWPFITRVSLSLSFSSAFIICGEYHSIAHFIEWFFCPPRHVRSCVAYLLLSLPFPSLTVLLGMTMLWSVTMPLHESLLSSYFPLPFHSHEERELSCYCLGICSGKGQGGQESRSPKCLWAVSCSPPVGMHIQFAHCNEWEAAFMRWSITTPPLLQSPGTECYDLFLIRAHSIMAPLEQW